MFQPQSGFVKIKPGCFSVILLADRQTNKPIQAAKVLLEKVVTTSSTSVICRGADYNKLLDDGTFEDVTFFIKPN